MEEQPVFIPFSPWADSFSVAVVTLSLGEEGGGISGVRWRMREKKGKKERLEKKKKETLPSKGGQQYDCKPHRPAHPHFLLRPGLILFFPHTLPVCLFLASRMKFMTWNVNGIRTLTQYHPYCDDLHKNYRVTLRSFCNRTPVFRGDELLFVPVFLPHED